MNTINDDAISQQIILTGVKIDAIGNKFFFEPLGLTASSVNILALLAKYKKMHPTEILRLVGSSKSNITQRLNFLEKSGFIARIGDKEKDKRKTLIALTAAGKAKFRQALALLKKRSMHIHEHFSQEEIDNCRDFLIKLNKVLDEHIELYFK